MSNPLSIIFLSFTVSCLSFQSTLGQEDQGPGIVEEESSINPYEKLYDQLQNLKADSERVAVVKDFTIQRDVAQIKLQDGELYLLSPIRDRTIAAMFFGEGQFSFSPPTEIEKEQLHRFYETRSLKKEFNKLFLVFADTTLSELEKNLFFRKREISKSISEYVEYCLGYLTDKKGKYFNTEIIKFILDNEQNDFFYAQFSDNKIKPMFFRINPYDVEEISLLERAQTPHFHQDTEVVCQFHKQEDYIAGIDLVNEQKDLIRIDHYSIESTIKKNLKFSATAEVEFTSVKANQNWFQLELFADLEVDSVFGNNSKETTYFKAKENPILWIKCDPPLAMGEFRKLKIYYHGDIIDRDGAAWIYIKAPISWYPTYGDRTKAIFDLTFHSPKKFKLVSVGDRVFSQSDNDMITTRWVTHHPISNASFNLGIYKQFDVQEDGSPAVTILMAEGRHFLGARNMEKKVGKDIANSLEFFQNVFGEIPVERFYVTEIPYQVGLAFPGMIYLSWITFQNTGKRGYDEIFRAHEVAHQWWGIQVDFKTYHDQWLSEGLSQYAGLWYLQSEFRDEKKVLDILKSWKKEILNNRKYLFGSGQEAGPIWLGYRTSTSKTTGDYNLIIYKKGAWVLHMLRAMMLDLETTNEDRFTNMLRDSYRTYRSKKASTEDFQKIVEKHVGMNMDWFFNQWVYGTEIPTYEFSHKTEQTPEGKFVVHCQVVQLHVPDDFQMYVPIQIDFATGDSFRVRKLIKGPVSNFDLSPTEHEPQKINFNHPEVVLCEVKNVKWKE